MGYTSTSIAFRGKVAEAMKKAHDQRNPGRDVSGKFPCPRCGTTLQFTTLSNGLSRGQCLSGAGCIRWSQ